MRQATEIVVASAAQAGGFVGYLDYADGEPFWLPPRGERRLAHLREERARDAGWGAPVDGVERSLEHLFEHRRNVTAGSFVFVLSDFLDPPSRETWLTAVEHLWDVIPVVIQDPVWEQSFPDVSGIVVPLRDPRSGRITHVRLTKKEVAARRRENEERLLALLDELTLLDLDPVRALLERARPRCSAPSSTGTSSAAPGAGWWREREGAQRSPPALVLVAARGRRRGASSLLRDDGGDESDAAAAARAGDPLRPDRRLRRHRARAGRRHARPAPDRSERGQGARRLRSVAPRRAGRR